MAVYVNTNYSALQGQRYLGNVQNQLTTTYQRLSSGMRINSAKDDAAGLQIADRLTSQINGLNQGNRNASDGIALAQTMEAGMDEISGMLQKMRTLTVQAANGTNTMEDRTALGKEIASIALAQTMEAGMDEISGMLQKMRTLTVQAANGTNTMEDRTALGKEIASLATEVNRIAQQTTFAGKTILNGKTKTGSIYGDDANAAQNALAGGAGAMTLQVGSNKGDTITFTANSVMFSAIGTNANLMKEDNSKFFQTTATGEIKVNVDKLNYADQGNDAYVGNVIQLMDSMISKVDGMRADLGAIQNRLESSIRNQSNVAANEADARSRIRDADFAEESANLSQQSIIQQAAASMLMQANTRPQLGLSLLG